MAPWSRPEASQLAVGTFVGQRDGAGGDHHSTYLEGLIRLLKNPGDQTRHRDGVTPRLICSGTGTQPRSAAEGIDADHRWLQAWWPAGQLSPRRFCCDQLGQKETLQLELLTGWPLSPGAELGIMEG